MPFSTEEILLDYVDSVDRPLRHEGPRWTYVVGNGFLHFRAVKDGRLGPRVGRCRDLTGWRSKTLEALRLVQVRRQGSLRHPNMAVWECRCRTCGTIVRRNRRDLVLGVARCTCESRIRKDLTGKVFGRLTVIGPSRKKRGDIRWLVRCRCGRERELRRDYLTSGDTRSCGCLRQQTSRRNQKAAVASRRSRRVKHGTNVVPTDS